MASRFAVFVYGVFCYLLFLGVFLYLAGFLANFLAPKGIDSGSEGPFGTALAINVGLLVLFGIQHTVMARPGFKKWWTSFVPEPIERSTYLLVTFLVMAPLFGSGSLCRALSGRSRTRLGKLFFGQSSQSGGG